MMSLAGVGGGSDAAGYYQTDNYYTREQASEASGWLGKGAEALGLKGPVDETKFAALLDGHLPNGKQIKSPSGEHRAGFDITLSAPKSVSLVALVGGDKRIETAMRESVVATMAWVEKNLIETRIWDKEAGRQVTVKSDNAVIASFFHDVNRNSEPQLHVHNVLANATLAPDGKWHAIRSEMLYENQHLIGAIHSAELRSRIEALGYETQASKKAIDGNFEIVGVNRYTIEGYSSRLDEINEHVALTGHDTARGREIAALETRSPKDPNLTKETVVAQWHAAAKDLNFDPSPLISASLGRQAASQTVWTKAAEGLRTVGAAGIAFAARMGLTPKDGDPLVPERVGRLDPASYATAQAVASAVRELGEREAAFNRFDVMRTALQHYGPFTVEHIQARIDLLVDKKLLVSGEQMMTTPAAIAQEQRVIDAARQGNSAASPIATGTDLASRLQVAAKECGLRRLNEGQVKAGIDVLTSTNRVHLIQGGAGVGKSAALAPVAAIARSEGHQVIALSHVGRMAREIGEKVGEDGRTVDSFLGKYGSVLAGKASTERVAEARAALGGAVIMIDEASQIGTERFSKLIALANQTGAARLIFAGDTRQLPAIEAGKPFDRLQDANQATSLVNENMRAKSEQMVALNLALEAKDMDKVFAILELDTTVVERGAMAEIAARMWAGLSTEDRGQTLILTASRALRSEANAAAQAELRALGQIDAKGVTMTVLDRVTITREGARRHQGYQDGRIAEFSTDLPKFGFEKGERGTVVDVKDGKVELQMSQGELRTFDPAKLPRNLRHDAVVLFEQKRIEVHEGDRIRWTANDAQRDFRNGDFGHVREVSPEGFTVETRDGQLHQIGQGDKMLERFDLGYAVNAHVAQGISEKLGILLMSAREKALNSTQTMLSGLTRFVEHVSVVMDDPAKIARDVIANPGGKTSAIEQTQGPVQPPPTVSPDIPSQAPETPKAPEPDSRDFGHSESQPEIEPDLGSQIEPDRDFDMDM